MTGLKSLQSLGLVAIIGLAPTAKVAFAESLITTLLVIWPVSHKDQHYLPKVKEDMPDARAVSLA